jgi:uncharacterized protein (DUF1501 family)
MDPLRAAILNETRRQFFSRAARGLGGAALCSLLSKSAAASPGIAPAAGALPGFPHFAPKAKRAVYLHMLGGPPQQDLFDYKPGLKDWYDKDLPDSVRQGQRLTTMSSGQSRFPIAPSIYKFAQHGQSGAWISELLPYIARMADDVAIVKSLHTEQINHEPAITFVQTGSMIGGRPCIGSWLAYGLGSMNENLPTFVVMNAAQSNPKAPIQAMSARMWSAGFLPARYSGVALRSGADPVLFINNPDGVPPAVRRAMLDGLAELNQLQHEKIGDPETISRIAQFEMAYRMQTSVPELTDLASESAGAYELYGEDARKPGTFAYSCLMTRRLFERGVRFVQIYHNGWDFHGTVPGALPSQARDVDQACWALVQDLKARGMLDDTLVIWAGEFGRTTYSQGRLSPTQYGRDHHPRCFTIWMAGGGVKPGIVYGETDDFSYNIVSGGVHVRDFQATILHQFGIDHERFSHRSQGLDVKLTGVEKARVVRQILS